MIRGNPLKHFDYLSPMMKSYYARRIVVLGSESTGTTTLANALADHYNTKCVPEFGRTYTEWKYGKGNTSWKPEEFIHIANEQNKLEDMFARNANKLLICDTDAFATSVWYWRYITCNQFVDDITEKRIEKQLKDIVKAREQNQIYIVTNTDIPFVQDEKNPGKYLKVNI